jgi:hypothetical protein
METPRTLGETPMRSNALTPPFLLVLALSTAAAAAALDAPLRS